jgi:hypothetical protein
MNPEVGGWWGKIIRTANSSCVSEKLLNTNFPFVRSFSAITLNAY